jgi:hypothetical protein
MRVSESRYESTPMGRTDFAESRSDPTSGNDNRIKNDLLPYFYPQLFVKQWKVYIFRNEFHAAFHFNLVP